MARSRMNMYLQMAAVGIVFCAGGPALMYYVTPSEEELFKRFSPDLQKRNLESRERRTEEYLDFASKMKEYSKSDKPIWEAAEEAQRKQRAEILANDKAKRLEQERMKEEMRASQRAGMRGQ